MNAEDGGFAHFVEVRQRALQRTAWLLTGDWALAEDLVQTALARSWPRWERIRRRDDPEIYVRRVMVNTWTGWNRRRWRAEHPTEAMPDYEAAECGKPSAYLRPSLFSQRRASLPRPGCSA